MTHCLQGRAQLGFMRTCGGQAWTSLLNNRAFLCQDLAHHPAQGTVIQIEAGFQHLVTASHDLELLPGLGL